MFAVRLDDAMRDALDRAAEAEGNTAAGLARLAIREWLKQKGFLK
jgi:predicted transcriptional regulator